MYPKTAGAGRFEDIPGRPFALIESPVPARYPGSMPARVSRILRFWLGSVLLAFVFVVRVSADPPSAPDAGTVIQVERDDPRAREISCTRLQEQGEEVDCWCAQAVASAAFPEIGAVTAELDRHSATWRQELLRDNVTKPCLKRCAEAFDATIIETARDISRYEASKLLSEVAGRIPRGACPEAEKYNDQLLHYECWRRRGDITTSQYNLLTSYGYNSPAHNSMRHGTYLTHVRSRAAKRSCMLACCGSAPPIPGYPDHELRNRRIKRAGEMYRD